MKSIIANDRGSALLIVMMLIAMLSIVSIMSVDRATTDIDLSYNQLQADQAFYIAEAGVQRAVEELNSDDTWRIGFANESFGAGIYSVVVVDSSSNAALVDTIVLRATATLAGGGAAASLEAWIVPGSRHPFQHSLFSGTTLEIDGSCTDSYNSDSGSYASTQVDSFGTIGANGTVNINSGAVIAGDASSATAAGITVSGGSTILGDTTTTADSVVLDLVPDSEYVWAANNNNIPAGLSGSYSYNPATKALEFSSLVLADGVYFFSSLYGQQGATLSIAPGAEVTIYVTGETYIEHGAQINPGGSTLDLVLFTKGPLVHIEDSAAFYGVIYGPETYFYVEGQADMYGSVYAKKAYIEGSSCFHYDRNLANYSKGSGEGVEVVAWREL